MLDLFDSESRVGLQKLDYVPLYKKVDSKIINIFLVEKIMEKSDLFRHQQSSFVPQLIW